MQLLFEATGSAPGLISSCHQLAGREGVHGLLILACDQNGFTPQQLDKELAQISVPLFGTIFPSIIVERSCHRKQSTAGEEPCT